MAVLARDAADYHELIEPAFAEHGIPFFVDRRRAASHHPLLQFVRAALRLASGNWPHEPMMALLKSGLAGVSADDAGEIENFVLEHRLYGSAWADRKPWSFARRRRDDGDGHTPDPQSARMDALRRRLVARLGMFLGAVRCSTICVRQIVAHLYQLLESFQVRQTLSAWMRDATAHNRHEEAAEHEQAWRELGELFDQLVDLMGSEILPIDEFLEIVEVGLEEFDLALTPPTLDQVLVGQVDRSRLPETKAVILLGLNEGEFPRSPRGDAILGDRDRTLLRSQRQDLFEDLSRELLDERFLGYVAMTRASQTLILTRSLADPRGRKREASSLWRDVEEMLPDCTPVRIPLEAQRKPEHIATPRQLVTSLLRWARRPDAQALADATHSALYQWLATRPENEDDPTVRLARQAWASLCYTNEATLSPHIAKRLYDSSLNVTARQLESFAACPFKHFAEYTLKLQARPQDDVTGADISNACHRILGDIVRMLVQQRPDWPKLREALSQEAFDNVVATVGQELRGELLLSSARNRYLLGRIRRTIDQVLAAQEAMSSRCDFRPAAAGVRFGEGQKVPALPLKSPKGREASLSGQIDRVDVLEDQTAFAIFDYRLHGSTLALDWIFHGLSLELLLHAAVLRRGGLVPPTAQPAGAFFLTLLRRLQDIKHPEDLPDPSSPEFLLRYKPRGLFDERYLNRFDCDLDEGYSPVVSAYVKKDGTLGNRGRSDVLEAGQLESLLDLVERRASELIDQIADGRVEIEPYRLKDTSPCATCAFRCVCRFEVTINRYRHLPPVEREAMFGSSAKGDE
jgi:ATP-dependent helicase/nuclease subunit B